MSKKLLLLAILFSIFNSQFSIIHAQDTTSPGARWWWLGSAVDKENLRWNMEQYASHGIGALEITPLYGVKGNETNNNTQIMVGRNTENKPGENIYNRTNIGPNNTNINYKISVYTKRSERNAEKNKQNP